MRATGLKRLAKDWMEPLMKRTDWDQCMAAIDDRNRRETARQMDYRKARDGSNLRVDCVKIQPIDPMAELVSI